MKRAKFLFPLMFLVALAGAAFSYPGKSSKPSSITAYFEDNLNMCHSYVVTDGKCIKDNLNYICKENVPGYGTEVMLQYKIGNVCYQPYYSYTP